MHTRQSVAEPTHFQNTNPQSVISTEAALLRRSGETCLLPAPHQAVSL